MPVTRSVRLTDTHGVEKVFPKERKRMVVCRPSTLRWGSRNGSSPLCFNEKLKLSWLLSRGQILSGKIILRFNYSSPLPPPKKNHLNSELQTHKHGRDSPECFPDQALEPGVPEQGF